jgi:hypothetical protein
MSLVSVSPSWRAWAAALALSSLLCSPAGAQGIGDRINSWFGLGGSSPAPSGSTPEATEIECPSVDIRQGASTLSITTPGTDSTPMSTRYQVSIGQTARECAALGGVMTMKVGVQGRVLLGPAGGPGRVDIPLRVAVVEEGMNPKPVVSRLYRIAIDVPPGQTSVPFVHVEQDLTFPMPRPAALESYVVYVGFDPSAAAPAKPERKTKAKPKQKQPPQ